MKTALIVKRLSFKEVDFGGNFNQYRGTFA